MANRSRADTAILDTQIYRMIVKGLTTREISVELKTPFTNNSNSYQKPDEQSKKRINKHTARDKHGI